VVLVATIRADGTPRLSPVEPFVLDGVLWLPMLWGSAKAADRRHDPRILVHSAIASRDGGQGRIQDPRPGHCRAGPRRPVPLRGPPAPRDPGEDGIPGLEGEGGRGLFLVAALSGCRDWYLTQEPRRQGRLVRA
jgi:hypothetical protein